MLTSPMLDDTRFDTLFRAAIDAARARSGGWDPQRLSDPGVTLIENMAMLTDMQRYYLDTCTPEHLRAYLKLLGLRPLSLRCTRAAVHIESDMRCTVPRGTRLLLGGIPFETARGGTLTDNRLCKVHAGDSGSYGLDLLMRQRGAPLLGGTPEGNCFTLTFARGFEPDEEVALYFTIRTPLGSPSASGITLPDEVPPSRGSLAWETRDAAGNSLVPRLIEDSTRGLRCSGFVRLRLPQFSGGYSHDWLRCTAQPGYRRSPDVQEISLNVLPALQKETLAEPHFVRLYAGESGFALDSALAARGTVDVYAAREAGLWEDCTPRCRVEHTREGAFVQLDAPCAVETRFLAVCRTDDMPRALSDTLGVPSQRVALPWENILRPAFKLLVRAGDGSCFRLCTPGGTFPACFALEDYAAVLGDGCNAPISPASTDGVRAVSLVLSRGTCALQPGADVEFAYLEEPHAVSLIAVNMGRAEETPEQAYARARTLPVWSATSERELELLALNIPGLAVRSAAAFRTGRAVTVAVLLDSEQERPGLSPDEREILRRCLDARRLLGITLDIRPPDYLPLRVRLSVSVRRGGAVRQALSDAVYAFADGVRGQSGFGARLHRATLLDTLHQIPDVTLVKELTLTPVGDGAVRLPGGDLELGAGMLPCVESLELLLLPDTGFM